MNRLLHKLPLLYLAITILIVIASWLGSYYGADTRNVLSAEGVRWIVENLIENVRVSPLADFVFLLTAISVVVESGLLKAFSVGNKSPKQRMALQMTLGVFLIYLTLLAAMTIFSSSILLSVFGTISDSPFSRGALGLVVVALLLVGNFYGFTSGRFLTVHDFINAHCEFLRRNTLLFVSVVVGAQLMGVVNYSFLEGYRLGVQTFSIAVYYIPFVLHLFVSLRKTGP